MTGGRRCSPCAGRRTPKPSRGGRGRRAWTRRPPASRTPSRSLRRSALAPRPCGARPAPSGAGTGTGRLPRSGLPCGPHGHPREAAACLKRRLGSGVATAARRPRRSRSRGCQGHPPQAPELRAHGPRREEPAAHRSSSGLAGSPGPRPSGSRDSGQPPERPASACSPHGAARRTRCSAGRRGRCRQPGPRSRGLRLGWLRFQGRALRSAQPAPFRRGPSAGRSAASARPLRARPDGRAEPGARRALAGRSPLRSERGAEPQASAFKAGGQPIAARRTSPRRGLSPAPTPPFPAGSRAPAGPSAGPRRRPIRSPSRLSPPAGFPPAPIP
jgi:hypothetical protein